MAAQTEPPARESEFNSNSWSSPQRFLLLVAAYFVLQIILRLITSRTLDLDEAEQLLATQQLQWGYGPQPPLYTWLLFTVMHLTGPSLVTLTLFKNALLFGIYALTYASARMVFHDSKRSALAALSLIFVPQLSWEAQSDLTHSIMVTFMAVVTFCAFLKLNQSRTLRWYCVFGACLGLGTLSKYSFIIFAAGLILGAAFVPSIRAVIFDWRLMLSLVIAGMLVTPHLIWCAHHREWVASTVTKFKMESSQPWLVTRLIGLKNLVMSSASHLAPPVIIYCVVCWKLVPGFDRKSIPATARVIGAALVSMFVLLAVGVVLFKITAFKERWFLPLCIWTPLLLVAVFSSRLNATRMKWLAALAGLAALAISVLIPSRIWFAQVWKAPQPLNVPMPELVAEIGRATTGRFVIAHDNWVGGNLRLGLPGRFVLSPNNFLDVPVRPGDTCIVVWDARRSVPLPERILEYANQFAELNTNAQYVAAPMKFRPGKTMRLGFMTGKMSPDPAAVSKSLPLHR